MSAARGGPGRRAAAAATRWSTAAARSRATTTTSARRRRRDGGRESRGRAARGGDEWCYGPRRGSVAVRRGAERSEARRRTGGAARREERREERSLCRHRPRHPSLPPPHAAPCEFRSAVPASLCLSRSSCRRRAAVAIVSSASTVVSPRVTHRAASHSRRVEHASESPHLSQCALANESFPTAKSELLLTRI